MWNQKPVHRSVHLKLIALTVIYSVVVPILIIVCSPLYLLRLVLQFVLPTFRIEGIVSIISARSSVFAADDITGSPKATIVVHVTVDGLTDLNGLQGKVLSEMIHRTKESADTLLYPELQQYAVQFMGFSFWRQESNFKIEDHVWECFDPFAEFRSKDLNEIHEKLIRKPFRAKRSPWEFILLLGRNVDPEDEDVHIFFRFHHCLSDGFSILQLLMTELTGQELALPRVSKVEPERKPFLHRIAHYCVKILLVTYEQVCQRYFSKDINIWHHQALNLSQKYHAIMSDRIEVDFIRDVKQKRQDCTFSALILAGLAGGIRKYFQEHEMPLIDQVHVVCPLPITQRPEGIGNYWTFALVPLPVQESDRNGRLQKIITSLQAASKSTVPIVNYYLIPLVGALPSPLISQFGSNTFSTGMASIFPGPRHRCYLNGHSVKDMVFGGGFLNGDQGT